MNAIDECQKSCPTLAYGANCERSCRDVCDVRGMLNCNPVNGSCECRPGYTGPRCDQSRSHLKLLLDRRLFHCTAGMLLSISVFYISDGIRSFYKVIPGMVSLNRSSRNI